MCVTVTKLMTSDAWATTENFPGNLSNGLSCWGAWECSLDKCRGALG